MSMKTIRAGALVEAASISQEHMDRMTAAEKRVKKLESDLKKAREELQTQQIRTAHSVRRLVQARTKAITCGMPVEWVNTHAGIDPQVESWSESVVSGLVASAIQPAADGKVSP